jgi:hypothetical protein
MGCWLLGGAGALAIDIVRNDTDLHLAAAGAPDLLVLRGQALKRPPPRALSHRRVTAHYPAHVTQQDAGPRKKLEH